MSRTPEPRSAARGIPDPGAPLSARLFGRTEFVVRGTPCAGLRSKARWLLALLLLRKGEPIERAVLAAQLWPDSLDTQALYNLRRELSALRRALGEEAGRLSDGGDRTLAFDADGCGVDVAEFDACVAGTGESDLARAVELHRGPLLEGCLEEWALPLRDARQAACAGALERLVGHALERGDLAAADAWLLRLLALDPLRESAHRERIRLLGRRHEFAAAVQAYRELRLRLHRELGAEPDAETTAVYERVRASARARPATRGGGGAIAAPERPQPPAPLTRLIGRAPLLAELLTALGARRLVTLTGPPGVGKTRLALQAAADVPSRFPDGVAFVELAPLTDEIQLADTLATALGVQGRPGLSAASATKSYLRARRLLLVFDNCEHLPAAARLIDELLAALPELAVLATSRQSLGLPGETILQVAPLDVPDPGAGARERDADSRSAALALFVERIALVRPGFELDADTVGPAIEICRRLEGIPLCLELASARVRTLSIAEILRRLDMLVQRRGARRDAGTHRHGTFHAALDWSHELLSPPEQVVLRRLACFAGSWSLEAAEAVCAGDGIEAAEVLELIEGLIDNSLVQRDEHDGAAGESRYRLLEPVRQYARARLVDAGEEARLRARHLEYFAGLADAAAPHLFGGGQDSSWPQLLGLDLDNLRAALRAAQDQKELAREVVRAGTALQWFWFANGQFREGRRYLADALELATDLPPLERARALIALAYLAYWEGDFAALDDPLAESLAIHEQHRDRWGAAYAGSILAFRKGTQGEPDATGAMAAAVAAARETGDPTLASIALWWQGMLHQHGGELDAARACFEEVLQTIRAQRHATGIGHALYPLARLALADGDLDAARRLFDESMTMLGQVGNEWGVLAAITGLVEVAAARGDHPEVARLLGALEAGRERIGGGATDPEVEQQRRLVERAREAMGGTAFEARRAAGRALSWREIVADPRA